jgi:hypothetical protein
LILKVHGILDFTISALFYRQFTGKMNDATELAVMINITFLSSLPFSYQLNNVVSNGFKVLMYWSTIAIRVRVGTRKITVQPNFFFILNKMEEFGRFVYIPHIMQ